MSRAAGCPLCEGPGGSLVFECAAFRVIRANEAGFPAFYRVVWQEHVAEFSDLSPADRSVVMSAAVVVEQALREVLQPDKINLAALGNAVPHLHWHVVARYRWDERFPASVWSPVLRAPDAASLQAVEAKLEALDALISQRLRAGSGNCTGL
ncbi:HIT family protein [Caenimonas koreensis]|uniref:HIT domain-containing protein n=1 Tax=Caenimonas koreensis DSM 17982 TaxID=1121255 RepID=A0A844B3F8_9BURK|nr:HIT family protein [Caenimonas koreensis]MRD46229.1 HIT domain-containing protein [Caenimonas koreensis DSM 17982]